MARPENRAEVKRVSLLRNFLMRNPRPTAYKLVTEDGEQDYQVQPNENFALLAERFDSLDPLKITAYDEKGDAIRAWKSEDLRNEAAPQIELPEGIKGDPSAAMLLHVSNLLARAYEHTTDVAFERLSGIVEMMMDDNRERNERLKVLENLYFNAMHANVELHNAAAGGGGGDDDEDGDFGSQMLRNFMGGVKRAKKRTKPTQPETNEEDDEAAE